MLKDSGAVMVENGEAILNNTQSPDHSDAAIPRTLNNVIINRVDRLDRTTKLILRVASVIGMLI